jgi:hypothetical protein
MRRFDFAIVGSGTAICVFGARLSEDAVARVLLEHYLPGTDPGRCRDGDCS